eukprot:Skav217818  [mRNA]  locus=scaffold889:191212:211400:+ [translate_table: standard]
MLYQALEAPHVAPLPPKHQRSHEVQDKLLRAGGFAVEGAKRAAPLLSLPWALGVRAVVPWRQVAVVDAVDGFIAWESKMNGIKTLLSLSSTLQDIPPKELLVGILYLSAEQRKTLRDSPDGFRRLASKLGRPLPPHLLDVLLGLACIGTFAPYHDTAFEVQRFALQQNWRLVTERLGESRKHRPAWALFIQHSERLAAVSIRGTHVEQRLGRKAREAAMTMGLCRSRGGDLFTDCDAELQEIYGAQAGYRIILTGHSLGGGVAAVLLWLLRYGTEGERLEAEVQGIGYAVPSVVDHRTQPALWDPRRTSEALRPFFTSVVNSMDAVPRLSRSTLGRLAAELSSCAAQSADFLDEDVAHVVERLSTVDGTPAPKVPDALHTQHADDEHRELWRSHSDDEVDLSPGCRCNSQAQRYIPGPLGDGHGTGSMALAAWHWQLREIIDVDHGILHFRHVMQTYYRLRIGTVVWIHRVRGHLEAAVALLAVRSRAASANSGPAWQKFSDAGEKCFEWMNTARSSKMRCHAMSNCRACGLVVCVACASTRRAMAAVPSLRASRAASATAAPGAKDPPTVRCSSSLGALAPRANVVKVAGGGQGGGELEADPLCDSRERCGIMFNFPGGGGVPPGMGSHSLAMNPFALPPGMPGMQQQQQQQQQMAQAAARLPQPPPAAPEPPKPGDPSNCSTAQLES